MKFCRRMIAFAVIFAIGGCSYLPTGMEDMFRSEQPDDHRIQGEAPSAPSEAVDDPRQVAREAKSAVRVWSDKAEGLGLLAYAEDVCIGGDKCLGGMKTALVLPLDEPVFVEKVVFHADDYIGRKHNGRIAVYLDQMLVREGIDIKKRGARHEVAIGKTGRKVELRTQVDDEVQFQYVKVYGEQEAGGKHPSD